MMHCGKQPATHDPRDLRYADLRASLPAIPPPAGGYGMDFGLSGWLMLGNGPDDTVAPGFQGCGDCAWAGPAHETMEAAYNAQRTIPKFSGATIVNQYAEYSGYDPQTGENDNGSNVRDVLKWRQTKGLLDNAGAAHKIGPYVALEPGDHRQLWEALYLFEAVGVGIEFPASAMDQFNSGQTWSVVPGSPVEGGHYVPIVGHPTPGLWTVITWGRRQLVTDAFLAKYCDEAWAWVDAERYNAATGLSHEGYTAAALHKYLLSMLA